MSPKNVKKIAILPDSRLSPTHLKILTSKLNAIRRTIDVDFLKPQMKEADIIQRHEEENYSLILVPWHMLADFTKLDGILGRTRGRGPTLGGYLCEPIAISKFLPPSQLLRFMVIDFFALAGSEITKILKVATHDEFRNGIQGFIENDSKIYVEEWFNQTGYGHRTDSILRLPEVVEGDWKSRANEIRITLLALWSFIYEEGPGKGDMNKAISPNQRRGYFQVSAGTDVLVFRLCFERANWKSKDAVTDFWPSREDPSKAPQLLIRYSDFVRVQTISNHTGAEIIVAFFSSAPGKRIPLHVHNLWIEPISSDLVKETPYETPSENNNLTHLPLDRPEKAQNNKAEDTVKAKDRIIQDLSKKVREAQLECSNKERLIRELKMGGIGSAQPLPPPDGDALLSAFQDKFLDNHEKIIQIENEIKSRYEKKEKSLELTHLEKRLSDLLELETKWIRKIATTIQIYKDNQASSDKPETKKKKVA